MKKTYINPTTSVYKVNTVSHLLLGSTDETNQQTGFKENVDENDFTGAARQDGGSSTNIWDNQW